MVRLGRGGLTGWRPRLLGRPRRTPNQHFRCGRSDGANGQGWAHWVAAAAARAAAADTSASAAAAAPSALRALRSAACRLRSRSRSRSLARFSACAQHAETMPLSSGLPGILDQSAL